MNELNNKLEEKLIYGYEFHLSKYVEDGIQLFRQYLPGFIAFTILYLLLQMTAENLGGIGAFIFLLAVPALQVGWFCVAHQIHNNQPTEPQDFFQGFQDWGRLMGMYLIMFGIFMLLALPVISGMANTVANNGEGMETINPLALLSGLPSWAFLVLLPIIYLTVAWRWAPLFIVFNKMDPWQALETSRKLINKKWFILFIFTILLGAIGGAGEWLKYIGFPAILAYVLSVFLLPITACIEYEAFAEVTALNTDEEPEITQHLVD